MSGTLLIAASPGEVRGALMEDGRLVELRIERLGQGSRVGDIHLGRVVRILPALPAALVDIGLGEPAFLSEEDAVDAAGPGNRAAGIAAWLHEGQAVLAQVTRDAQGEKAVGISLRLRLKGRYLALTPTRPRIALPRGADEATRQRLKALLSPHLAPNEGAALGAAALAAAPAAVLADLATVQARWRNLVERARQASPPALIEAAEGPLARLLAGFAEAMPATILIDDRAAFAEARSWLAQHGGDEAARLAFEGGGDELFARHGIAEEVEQATEPRVPLPGAGALTIEETAAMTVIDVDTGAAIAGRSGSREVALAVNRAAAREAARQIRLRNLAGAIVIDFVSMPRRADRESVAAALAAALAADPAQPQLLGWTRLGHIELTRRRRHKPLAAILCEPAPGGGRRRSALTLALDALRMAAREAAQAPGGRLHLTLHPAVAAALGGAAAPARRLLEARLGQPLAVAADPERPREAFDIRRL